MGKRTWSHCFSMWRKLFDMSLRQEHIGPIIGRLKRLGRHLAQAQNVHATVELAARRSGVFQCNLSAERVRQEATEWSDKGSWLLVWVWAVCGGLCSSLIPGTVPQRPGRHRAEIQPAVLIRWWRSGSDWAAPGMLSSSTRSATHTHTHTHTHTNNLKISKWLKLWKWIEIFQVRHVWLSRVLYICHVTSSSSTAT